MKRHRSALTIACFALLLALGLVFALFGLLVVPMLPTLMLDVVVEPEHIADLSKRAETLAILKTAWGKTWVVWSGMGLLVAAISGLGLWANSKSDRAEAAS